MEVFELLKAILFGIVEGITEWLPISSTGHMILLDEFVKMDVTKEFLDMFLVVIQLGAILAGLRQLQFNKTSTNRRNAVFFCQISFIFMLHVLHFCDTI